MPVMTARKRWLVRLWRRVIFYAPAVVVVVGGSYQAITWSIDRSDKAKQAATLSLRESQRPFLEKQLQYYFEVSKVVAKLAYLHATTDDGPDHTETFEWAVRRFWELYLGELSVVESPEVASAMVAIGGTLDRLTRCRDAKKTELDGDCAKLQQTLRGASIGLAHALRKSIEDTWGYSLPNPPK